MFGRYNHSIGTTSGTWIESQALFALGNGTSSNESNALVVLKNGNIGVGLGQSAPTYLLEVGKNGDGTEAVANAWQTFSDIRLKKNFTSIENPLKKLKAINGYYYYWKSGSDTSRQIGVIAQEVEKVLPEIISENDDGYKSVDYSKLTPLLIEVVKNQNTTVTKQQTTIEELKIKNLELQTANDNLKKQINKLDVRIENIEEYIKAAANVNMNK